ncbi:MAG: oligosaccharide flippase family protein [Kofleriaceae bacterium]
MLGGQLARTVVQAAYFILVARTLQPDAYGAFVAVSATVMIGAPFVSLGSGFIMVKHVSRDRETFPHYWNNALVLIIASGSLLLALSVPVSRLLLPAAIPITLVIVLGAAELICARIIELVGQAFLAVELVKWTATLQFSLSVLRLVAIGVVTTITRHPSAVIWGIGYLAATAIGVAVSVATLQQKIGLPRPAFDASRLELEEGFYFAIGLSAQTVYNDIDKSLVSRFAGLEAAGIYGAAYRIIDVCFAPVSALLAATYANFFRQGAAGLRASLALSRRLMPTACGYAFVCSLMIVLCAPLVPIVLGDKYASTVDALRWLAPIPLLRAVHYFLADALSGAGYQRARSIVQIGIAITNVVLLAFLVPSYGWQGAAWVSIASDALLAISLVLVARYLVAIADSRAASS